MRHLKEFLLKIGFQDHEMQANAPLCHLSSFKIGGPADILLTPKQARLLPALLSGCAEEGIPLFVLGGGSNLLISDGGIAGIVLSLKEIGGPLRLRPQPLPEGGLAVPLAAGWLLEEIVWAACLNGLSGLESFYGLPGTAGGAAYMNARCYDKEIADIFLQAEIIAFNGERKLIKKNNAQWAYKKSPFHDVPAIIETVWVKMTQDRDVEKLMQSAQAFKTLRYEKGHFNAPSAGSIFKNNRAFGKPSGQIIDSLNLRGLRKGQAQIALWHANFIINLGGATADEVWSLIEEVQQQVKEAYGFDLEPEILRVGRRPVL